MDDEYSGSIRHRLDTALMGDISDHRARIAEVHSVVMDLGTRLARIEERLGFTEKIAAEQAAKFAVAEVFNRLGIDVNNPMDLAKFRTDLSVGNAVRDYAAKSVWAVVTAVAGVIVTVVWLGIRQRVESGG